MQRESHTAGVNTQHKMVTTQRERDEGEAQTQGALELVLFSKRLLRHVSGKHSRLRMKHREKLLTSLHLTTDTETVNR